MKWKHQGKIGNQLVGEVEKISLIRMIILREEGISFCVVEDLRIQNLIKNQQYKKRKSRNRNMIQVV